MKKLLLPLLLLLTSWGYAQTPARRFTLLQNAAATATATGNAVPLAGTGTSGVLQVVETGITGSPSGCTLAIAANPFYSITTTVLQTVSFTPSTGTQFINISPAIQSVDQLVATYACSSTYPTAGVITVTFAPATIVETSYADPCQSPNVLKSSVVIDVTSAATTALVALSAGKVIYGCGFFVNILGLATTPGTFQLEYGTGASCSSPTVLTAAIPGSITVGGNDPVSVFPGHMIFSTPAANAVCAVTTGTAPSFKGIFVYVQQAS